MFCLTNMNNCACAHAYFSTSTRQKKICLWIQPNPYPFNLLAIRQSPGNKCNYCFWHMSCFHSYHFALYAVIVHRPMLATLINWNLNRLSPEICIGQSKIYRYMKSNDLLDFKWTDQFHFSTIFFCVRVLVNAYFVKHLWMHTWVLSKRKKKTGIAMKVIEKMSVYAR